MERNVYRVSNTRQEITPSISMHEPSEKAINRIFLLRQLCQNVAMIWILVLLRL
jgi:hypothetical protein